MTTGARRTPRRGFALLTVVAMVAVVGMAVVGMSSLFAADAGRTRAAVRDAQVRQLLEAGAVAAPGIAAGWDGKAAKGVEVKLPEGLRADGGSLTVRLQNGEGATVEAEVTAAFEGRRGWQTLTYARKGDGMELVGARAGE